MKYIALLALFVSMAAEAVVIARPMFISRPAPVAARPAPAKTNITTEQPKSAPMPIIVPAGKCRDEKGQECRK
jgi:hypothetical protein